MKTGILRAKVYHKRLMPRGNAFTYKAYYLVLDMNMAHKNTFLFSVNRMISLLSFYDKDHGQRDGSSSKLWAENIFKSHDLYFDKLFLVTMPRVLGYTFNPVSFWCAFSKDSLVGVIAEVNNTFGQTHSYVCLNKEGIQENSWFSANKSFHVSPFYDRKGSYRFNFDVSDTGKISILIHYYNNEELQLITSIKGETQDMNKKNILKAFVTLPPLKVIFLIHYQALKIFFKRAGYRKLPLMEKTQITTANYININ